MLGAPHGKSFGFARVCEREVRSVKARVHAATRRAVPGRRAWARRLGKPTHKKKRETMNTMKNKENKMRNKEAQGKTIRFKCLKTVFTKIGSGILQAIYIFL